MADTGWTEVVALVAAYVIAVVATPAGDSDGLEPAGALVRVVTAPHHPRLLWVHEHLQHLSSHVRVIADPASHVAEQRRLPWWR